MRREEYINEFVQSKPMACLMGAVGLGASWWAAAAVNNDFWWQWAFIGLTCALLLLLNRRYAFMSGMTTLMVGMYAILEAAVPEITGTWHHGNLLALAVVFGLHILYASYEKRRTERFMLVAAIIAAGGLLNVAFLYTLIPIALATVQLRQMTFKTLLALALGTVLPYWLAVGLGLVPLEALRIPVVQPLLSLSPEAFAPHLIAAAVALAIGIVAVALNFLHLVKYKQQLRVYNGVTLVLMLYAALMMVVDGANSLTYLPLLNAMVALQVAHAYRASEALRRYIFVILIIAAEAAIYLLL